MSIGAESRRFFKLPVRVGVGAVMPFPALVLVSFTVVVVSLSVVFSVVNETTVNSDIDDTALVIH